MVQRYKKLAVPDQYPEVLTDLGHLATALRGGSASVVVERPQDVAILRAVLPPDLLRATTLVPGGGRANLISIARTLLVTHRKPVAVLLDADSIEEAVIQDRRQSAQELLRMVSAGIPVKVIVLVPHIEALFFQAPDLIPRIFGEPLTEEIRLLARWNPKEALENLLARPGAPQTVQGLLDLLSEEGAEALRSTGPIQELISFLQDVVNAAAKAAVT